MLYDTVEIVLQSLDAWSSSCLCICEERDRGPPHRDSALVYNIHIPYFITITINCIKFIGIAIFVIDSSRKVVKDSVFANNITRLITYANIPCTCFHIIHRYCTISYTAHYPHRSSHFIVSDIKPGYYYNHNLSLPLNWTFESYTGKITLNLTILVIVLPLDQIFRINQSTVRYIQYSKSGDSP